MLQHLHLSQSLNKFLLKLTHLRQSVILGFILVVFIAQFMVAQTAVASTLHPFTAHMMIGGDVTVPTVPDPFGATAVSDSQIDLVWGASSDDTALAGYRVFRDLVQIATTTLTTFSDTGLTAETAYTYSVDAFDVFYNYSSSSDFATATTLVAYVPPPTATTTPSGDKSSAGQSVAVIINSVIVTPQQFSVKLQWMTNIPTSYVIRWGRTDSYELGSVHGGQYLFEHGSVITDLELATKYFYEIEARGGMGVRKAVFKGEFVTSGTIPDQAVANVLGLRAVVENNSARFDWQNPVWSNFSSIRIVRSHLFYPQNATDGKVVYEGTAQSFYDKDIFLTGSTWYYAIFVYDKSGRISSGATTLVTKEGDLSSSVSPLESADVDLFAMNVALSQGRDTSYLHDPAPFLALEPLFVSIPVTAVPRHLKSIIVNVTQPGRYNESSSYLLKINPAGTAYETLLPPALEAGQSRLTVTLYNYELATVRTVSNIIEFEVGPRSAPLPLWVKALYSHGLILSFLFFVLVLILYRWWCSWREMRA